MKYLLSILLVFFGISAFAAEKTQLQSIVDSGVLKVGTPGDYRPFSMLNKDTNKFEGYDIDVIELLASELGVKIEYVKTSWPELMEGLQSNKYDIAVGGITQNIARIKVADFLPAYAPSSKVPLIKAADMAKYKSLGDIDKPTVTVIVNPGGTNEKFVIANIKNAKVITHPNNHEIPAMIAEGKGDVMFTDAYEAVVYSKLDKRLTTAKTATPLTRVTYMGFMIRNNDKDFTRVMNFLWNDADRRGDLNKIAEKWLK